MASLFDALIGPLWPFIAAALSAVGVALYGRSQRKQGRRERDKEHAADAAQAERATHDRITNAPTGGGMSDDERREWLRDIAENYRRHNRPPSP